MENTLRVMGAKKEPRYTNLKSQIYNLMSLITVPRRGGPQQGAQHQRFSQHPQKR